MTVSWGPGRTTQTPRPRGSSPRVSEGSLPERTGRSELPPGTTVTIFTAVAGTSTPGAADPVGRGTGGNPGGSRQSPSPTWWGDQRRPTQQKENENSNGQRRAGTRNSVLQKPRNRIVPAVKHIAEGPRRPARLPEKFGVMVAPAIRRIDNARTRGGPSRSPMAQVR